MLAELRDAPRGPIPRIAIVTPSHNYAQYIASAIDSVLAQNYPNLSYHVQDGGSSDGTLEVLKNYGDRISWSSQVDGGQSHAINAGFAANDSDLMAYLNSDDMFLPGALAYVARFFEANPDVDLIYGHRIFIDRSQAEIGRAILPAHDSGALYFAAYIPQETMFWRRRVWEAVGPIDEGFQYAMDWEFQLRAQKAGFKFARVNRFLACFRVHDQQKTSATYDIGHAEMQTLRKRYLGHSPGRRELLWALLPYLTKQYAYHLLYNMRVLRI
jgi:glycosyltransferase involved in cell wall biosynthesis